MNRHGLDFVQTSNKGSVEEEFRESGLCFLEIWNPGKSLCI